jgi:2,4-dienoyl-CoA reductase-like NADH-dependent reductase (Old Yellow Enzyme family)
VRSATGESRADTQGIIKDDILPIYEALAAGGVGLIVSGHMYIHADGKCSPHQTGIWDDKHIPGLKRLAAACRRNGTKAVAQLNYKTRDPAGMSLEDIREAEDCFVAAARRAVDIGLDGVQIHAAHGYLISGFLTPAANRRDDDFGRDATGRRRMLLNVVRRIRDEIGKHAALLCKLGAMDGRDNSLPLEETVETAKAMEDAGLDAVEISAGFAGDYAQPALKDVDAVEKEAYFADVACAVKQAVAIPVILVGGLRSLDVMERVVNDDTCDMVAMSRPLIREPDLVNAFREGRTRRAACVSCNECFNPRGTRCVFVR